MADANLRTVLYPTHQALGGRTIPFGGWDMPVQYSGILAEVRAVRTACGIFDVSHMGRLYISGTNATEFLEWILTAPVATLAVGRARYSFICNEAGGIIDDTIFYRLDENRYLLVPNAGNRNAVVAWFQQWVKDKFANDCNIEDMTESSALIAFQGPSTADVMSKLGGAGDPLPKPFSWANFSLQGKQVLVGRTGYTGEDGFEIVAGSADAVAVWQALLDSGAVPCGLGARDVLRLEAGLPLHGHEIDEHTSPVEAGLDRFVSFDKEYVGAPVLKEQRESGVQRKLVGLKLPGRSAPREGYPVLHQGQQIGQVTSGTYSPTLDTSIAMGYVLWRHAALGQALDLDIRGRIAEAAVVPLPFYSRPRRAL